MKLSKAQKEVIQKTYKIDSGLSATLPKEFRSPREAWYRLGRILPKKYVTLYERVTVHLPTINKREYIRRYKAKYLNTPTHEVSFWLPICEGISGEKWDGLSKAYFKGKKLYPETLKKLSEIRKGKTAWNKGKVSPSITKQPPIQST